MATDAPIAVRRREDLKPAAADRLSSWLRNYKPLPGVPDELFDRTGRPRDYWLSFLGEFAEYPQAEFENRFSLATRHIRDTGVTYRIYGEENERSWPLSPMPLILSQGEWAQIAEGVEQRANLIEALLQDFYGEGALVAEGALPAAALTGSADFVRAMRGVKPPGGRFLQLYAADLGRGPDGRWWVLDDRTQAPSGAGYALESRLVLSRAYPNLYNAMNVQRLAPFFDGLRKGLAATAERDDPRICLLTPGPFSETYFEQAHLARYLGFLLVEGDDLVVRDGRVYVRTIAGLKRADVILRRVDADFIDPLELNSASHLGVPGLLEAIRSGGVAVLNIPGSGVLESKALLGFLPKLCRRLLGEELKMPNVATWWCGQPVERALVERNLDNMAIAPAFNVPGTLAAMAKPRLVASMSAAEKAEFLARLNDRPGDYVGQEVVRLSTTPVLRDGRLEPAPFVLRVYAAMTPDGMKVMPGGFCRTSDHPDVRAISMGEDARTNDVWVISDRPVERVTLMASTEDVKVRRILGHLPSRAADNLFWLGRYIERAEATLRLVRSLCTSLMDSESATHSAGETLAILQTLLIEWGALDEKALGRRAIDAGRDTLHDDKAYGSVVSLVRSARRTAASMRERLSADFWTLLINLEASLVEGAHELLSEAEVLQQVENALQILAALSGLAQENMNRVAGWRFLDMGRRIERGVNTCRFTRALAHEEATIDDLDLLLDLADSQITYRARYLIGLALAPVRDMVVLDPFNTRSLAFQVETLKQHLDILPALQDDGMLEEPDRVLLNLAAQVETETAARINTDKMIAFELALMRLSDAIGERFFLRGANAVPTAKLAGLA
ncbi:MAG: circularly permuted type 2 ATP-grasp protein [Phenylobacterium sp.]|uniref:circularly permuted type 2 ATP-grasp protein n=1 Tax=Phenylobacterium sp. TaxID=1871053 RepID=UPI00273423C8|nr:circularly permuted type 2 ATP-grasp protein [Phenylobacterium sp.]MDP3174240.1 circularly permuted type 2 ATP-grasp protein [Phenylobacterium sp.]